MTEGQTSVYVKIADGCSRKCAFCAIPKIRGRAESRTVSNIVSEVKNLAEHGAVEINLVSQDTAAYGRDLKDGTDLVTLLKALNLIDGIKWIRVLYLYPDNVSDKLLKAIDSLDKVVPYLDIPVQHASQNMLRLMRRGHGPDKLKEVINRVRKHVRNPFLRTTVLVGFPGESSKDIDDLIKFINFAQFHHLGAFRYSNEEGTAAFGLRPAVSKRDSYNRWRRVMAAQRRIVKQNNRALIGTVVSVLIEETADEAGFVLIGRHEGQAPEIDGVTYLTSFDASPGQIVKGRIINFKDYDVVVEPV
jgi:ribosomal protein S12 methylthiotransferase